MLGNLRDLNWPECAEKTFSAPQALLLSLQGGWLAGWPAVFLTLEKLHGLRKTGWVPSSWLCFASPALSGVAQTPAPSVRALPRRFGNGRTDTALGARPVSDCCVGVTPVWFYLDTDAGRGCPALPLPVN